MCLLLNNGVLWQQQSTFSISTTSGLQLTEEMAPGGWFGFRGQCLVCTNSIVVFEAGEYKDSHLAIAGEVAILPASRSQSKQEP